MSPEQAQKLLQKSEQKPAPAEPASDEMDDKVVPGPAPTGPFDFNALPLGVQKLFEREASNYLRIGDEIWSIELWLRAQRFASASVDKREPYQLKDAPLFYRPVEGKRARQLHETMAGRSDAHLLTGSVMAVGDDSILLTTSQGLVLIVRLPGDWTYQKGDTLIAPVVRDGDFQYTANGKPAVGPRYTPAPKKRVRPVTPAELAQHFAVHRIDRFHRWQPRKVWDRQPKSKIVYNRSGGVRSEQSRANRPGTYRRMVEELERKRDRIASQRSTGREVITDPGEYHWQWVATGTPVPLLNKGFASE